MTESAPSTSQPAISRSRVEMLFDGIFAIAMTILVLELRVPDLADRHSAHEMSRALVQDVPTFISYLLSFVLLGILWYRHNLLYRHVERVSRRMLALQLLQLATAAFIPFCAALVGRYATNPFSMAVYSGCLMLYLWTTTAYWITAWRVGAMKPGLDQFTFRTQNRRNVRGSIAVTAIFIYYVTVILNR